MKKGNDKLATPIVRLNKECLSCSSNKTPNAYTLFKTACLNYMHSSVKYQDKNHPRGDLIDIQQ